MSALRDSFRRLLRAEGQSRSAKTVEVFGWLILIEGGLIRRAPHIVVWALHLPDLAEQSEHYFRLLGLLVGGVGMLYVVSGRMSAEGFVFASLLDRPLVPPAMALLWHFDIVPGPLALAFSIQDFGSFLWTLTMWLRERRPSTAALLERGDTFSDDLDSPSIRAIQAIYSAAMFEELKMFQVVDKLVALFRGGAPKASVAPSINARSALERRRVSTPTASSTLCGGGSSRPSRRRPARARERARNRSERPDEIAHHVTRSPGGATPPSDYDLVQAVERWLAASG